MASSFVWVGFAAAIRLSRSSDSNCSRHCLHRWWYFSRSRSHDQHRSSFIYSPSPRRLIGRSRSCLRSVSSSSPRRTFTLSGASIPRRTLPLPISITLITIPPVMWIVSPCLLFRTNTGFSSYSESTLAGSDGVSSDFRLVTCLASPCFNFVGLSRSGAGVDFFSRI